jgi:hypothetical protein
LALQAYSRVLSQAPAHVDAAYNAALMSLENGDAITAETLFRRAINADPRHELAHIKLAQALKALRKTDAWISLAKRIAAEFSGSLRGKLVRAETLRYEQDLAGETRDMLALAKSLCEESDHHLVEELAQPILCRAAATGLPESVVATLAARYLVALNESYARISLEPAIENNQIKIGFLVEEIASESVRQQLVNQFAKSFAHKNSLITFYALGGQDSGARPVSNVMSLAGLSATRAARQIAKDAPDVLIDLVGYRHPLAPAIMFQKPARMQLTNGAFANVFDCEAIDFEIFDQWTQLPKWQANGPTRPVMRLPSVIEGASNEKISSDAAAPKSTFIFAIGAAAQEISHESIKLWKSILDQVPHSMIAVPADSDAELRAYHDVLRAGGIGSTRITRLNSDATTHHRFARADAVLDTIPMSDAIVASEALAAGVAVIALRGPTAMERMAYSVLARHGLTELVADSGRDYIAVAAKYACKAAFRADLRLKLNAHLSTVSATDEKNETSTNYQALMFALNEIAKDA